MKNWEFQEWAVAKQLKGSLTPGSGNKGIKGDVYNYKDKFVIEVKSTEKEKIYLNADWLIKLINQHYTKGRSFGLCVSIDGVNTFYFCTKTRVTKEVLNSKLGSFTTETLPNTIVQTQHIPKFNSLVQFEFTRMSLDKLKEYIENEL